MSTPQTIVISPAGRPQVVRERLAVAAFSPGHLIEVAATGYQKHSTAAGNAARIFAGQNIADAGDITRAYVTGETSRGIYAQSGDEVYARVAAAAAAIAVGDYVESAGDGTLRKHTPQAVNEGGAAAYTIYTSAIVGQAVEAVDNSGGASEAFIKIEVL